MPDVPKQIILRERSMRINKIGQATIFPDDDVADVGQAKLPVLFQKFFSGPFSTQWEGVLLALLFPLIACTLQWLLWRWLQPQAWPLFFLAVFFSTRAGGVVGGILATLVSAILAGWFFIPFEGGMKTGSTLFSTVIFILMGCLFGLFDQRQQRQAQRARELFESSPDGIFVTDPEGRCTDMNSAACRMLGYARAETLGKSLSEFLTAASATRFSVVKDTLGHGETHFAEWECRCKDGHTLPVEVNATLLPSSRWKFFMRDIRERRRIEQQLRQAAIVFDNTDEGIVITDAQARIVSVNSAFTKITGYASEEVIGKNPRFQQSERQEPAFYQLMWASLQQTGQWRGELWNRRKNGEVFPVWENISVVKDTEGRVTHYISIQSDITVIKQAEERLQEIAYHDSLTGLANRRLFFISLQKALERAKRHQQRMALLFIDLDRFKPINDTLGHAAGDQVLQQIAIRLQQSVRAQDTAARLSGDEFVVIAENMVTLDDASALAEKIMDTIIQPVLLENCTVQIGASIGIAFYPDDAECIDDLLKASDAAMYRAKKNTRGNGRETNATCRPDSELSVTSK